MKKYIFTLTLFMAFTLSIKLHSNPINLSTFNTEFKHSNLKQLLQLYDKDTLISLLLEYELQLTYQRGIDDIWYSEFNIKSNLKDSIKLQLNNAVFQYSSVKLKALFYIYKLYNNKESNTDSIVGVLTRADGLEIYDILGSNIGVIPFFKTKYEIFYMYHYNVLNLFEYEYNYKWDTDFLYLDFKLHNWYKELKIHGLKYMQDNNLSPIYKFWTFKEFKKY